MTDITTITKVLRKQIVDLHAISNTSHIGSSLSCIDLLAVLYYKVLRVDPGSSLSEGRDVFILSKGHAAPALYSVLANRGFFDGEILSNYGSDGTSLFEHPEIASVPGVEVSTGSLGHGLSIGVGMALGLKKKNLKSRVFVLVSDGECQEGSVWEAAMIAPQLALDNLICIVDYNNLQGFSQTSNIQSHDKIIGRFRSSGWACEEINGHDLDQIEVAFSSVPLQLGKPSLILARTVKGKGIKEIENKLEWHYLSPSREQAARFKEEIDSA